MQTVSQIATIALGELLVGKYLTSEELDAGQDGSNPSREQLERVLKASGLTWQDFTYRMSLVIEDAV
ncbi:hypothetical protein WG915_08865 [Corynebacterium sp. H128]|uniref:hypothetical protein n=1 Tax=Corynebacterium sp. H128 TaxID=3133427 RepID=UPI0030B357E6